MVQTTCNVNLPIYETYILPALNMEFTDDGVIFAKQDIANIPELLTTDRSDQRMTYKDLAVFSLQAGPMSANDLAADLNIEPNKMRAILNRYKDTFEKVGDLWQTVKKDET